jgi:hypothetical protein
MTLLLSRSEREKKKRILFCGRKKTSEGMGLLLPFPLSNYGKNKGGINGLPMQSLWVTGG